MSDLKSKCADQVCQPSELENISKQAENKISSENDKENESVGNGSDGLSQTEEVYDVEQDYSLSEKIMEEYFPSMGDSPSLGLCTLFEEEDLVTIGEVARYWLQSPKNQLVPSLIIDEMVLAVCQQSLTTLLGLYRSCPLRFFADQLKISPHTLCITLTGEVVVLDIQMQPLYNSDNSADTWDFFDAPERHDIQLQQELLNSSTVLSKIDEEKAIRNFAAQFHLYSLGVTMKSVWDLRYAGSTSDFICGLTEPKEDCLETGLNKLLNRFTQHNVLKRPSSLEKALEELTDLVSQYKPSAEVDKESIKTCSQIATTTFTAIFNAQTEHKTVSNIINTSLDAEGNQSHCDGSKISNLDIDEKCLSPEPQLQSIDNSVDTSSTSGPKKTMLDVDTSMDVLENLDSTSGENEEPGCSSFSDDEGTYDLNLSSEKESMSSECESLSSPSAKAVETDDAIEPKQESFRQIEPVELQKDELILEKTDVLRQIVLANATLGMHAHFEDESCSGTKIKILQNEVSNVLVVDQPQILTAPEKSLEEPKSMEEPAIPNGGPRLALRLEGKWGNSEKDRTVSSLVSHPVRKSSSTERRQKTQTPKSRTRDASPFPTQKQVFKFDTNKLNIQDTTDQNEKDAETTSARPSVPKASNPPLPQEVPLSPPPVPVEPGPSDNKFRSSVQVSFGLNTKNVKQPQPPVNMSKTETVNQSKTAAVSFLSKTIQNEIEKERSTPTSSSGAASPSTTNSIDDELRAFSPQFSTRTSVKSRSQQLYEPEIAKFSLPKPKSSATNPANYLPERVAQASSLSNIAHFSSSPKRDILLTSPPPYDSGKKAFKAFYNLGSSTSSLTSTNKFRRFQQNFEHLQSKQNTPNTISHSSAHAPVYAQTCRSGPPVSRRPSLESVPSPSLDKYLEKLVKARSSDPPTFSKPKTAGNVPVGLAHKQIRSPEPMERSSPVPTMSSGGSVMSNLSREGSLHSLVSNTSDNSRNMKSQNLSRFIQQQLMNPVLTSSQSTFSIQSSISQTPQPNYVSRDMFGSRVHNVVLRPNMSAPQTPTDCNPRQQSHQSINVSRNALQNTQFRIEKDRIQVLSPQDGRETTILRGGMTAPVEIQIGKGGVNISFGSMNEELESARGYNPIMYNSNPRNPGNMTPLQRQASLPQRYDVNGEWARGSDYL